MKKTMLCILGCIMVPCLYGSFEGAKAQCTRPHRVKDTIRFYQKCIDTVYLPICQPTDEGEKFLDKILDSKHQNLIKYPNGIFVISEEESLETKWNVSYYDVNINHFAQYGWNSFKGIVYYRKYTFLIDSDVREASVGKLFKVTHCRTGFPEYSDRLFVLIEHKIFWQLVEREGQYLIPFVEPPNSTVDMNFDDFK